MSSSQTAAKLTASVATVFKAKLYTGGGNPVQRVKALEVLKSQLSRVAVDFPMVYPLLRHLASREDLARLPDVCKTYMFLALSAACVEGSEAHSVVKACENSTGTNDGALALSKLHEKARPRVPSTVQART